MDWRDDKRFKTATQGCSRTESKIKTFDFVRNIRKFGRVGVILTKNFCHFRNQWAKFYTFHKFSEFFGAKIFPTKIKIFEQNNDTHWRNAWSLRPRRRTQRTRNLFEINQFSRVSGSNQFAYRIISRFEFFELQLQNFCASCCNFVFRASHGCKYLIFRPGGSKLRLISKSKSFFVLIFIQCVFVTWSEEIFKELGVLVLGRLFSSFPVVITTVSTSVTNFGDNGFQQNGQIGRKQCSLRPISSLVGLIDILEECFYSGIVVLKFWIGYLNFQSAWFMSWFRRSVAASAVLSLPTLNSGHETRAKVRQVRIRLQLRQCR